MKILRSRSRGTLTTGPRSEVDPWAASGGFWTLSTRVSAIVGTNLGRKQTIDETAQSVSLAQDLAWDLDATRADQDEVALHLLVLSICCLEMLIPVTHRPPIASESLSAVLSAARIR